MTDDAEMRWRASTAAALYNRCWQLMDMAERTPDEDDEMLAAAFASRALWLTAGGPVQHATADWQVSHVCAKAGLGELAVRYAVRSLRTVETAEGMPDFQLASALEGVARAYAALGDAAERDRHLALATAALETIADADDREEIARQLATVPRGPAPS